MCCMLQVVLVVRLSNILFTFIGKLNNHVFGWCNTFCNRNFLVYLFATKRNQTSIPSRFVPSLGRRKYTSVPKPSMETNSRDPPKYVA